MLSHHDRTLLRPMTRRQLLSRAVGATLFGLMPYRSVWTEEKSTPACRFTAAYRAVQRYGSVKRTADSPVHILREFSLQGESLLLTLDPESLTTAILPLEAVTFLDEPPDLAVQSRYARLLTRQMVPPHPLVNAGLRRADHPIDGVCLTIDLCPAPKPMEYRLFEALMSDDLSRPVPLAIAVSGGWMRRHERDFAWLCARHAEGDFSITWINHSNTHFYDAARHNRENFFLANGSDPQCEVLALEWELIRRGVTPPPFFRFPGLVSSSGLLKELTELGLLVIGCETVVADGAPIRSGGIILLHGNGNEPRGVDFFLHHLRSPKKIQLVSLPELFRLHPG
ncbi:MAG: hypothetical protein H7834_00285 [Magnetococcus sp. YQC-9]